MCACVVNVAVYIQTYDLMDSGMIFIVFVLRGWASVYEAELYPRHPYIKVGGGFYPRHP